MLQQIGIELTPEVEARLMSLPTAVTLNERKLALYYVSQQWDAKNDIFENGPLLGGATRALAMGMLYHQERAPEARLRTYDWFSLTEPLDLADGTFEALAAANESLVPVVATARATGSFQPIFQHLHAEEDYTDVLCDYVGYLPGHRDQVAPDGAATFRLAENAGPFSMAFIDGCKSWYGTKHWFREIAPRLLPDADILFQDFGHYTCFWLPMLIGTFRDRFELIGYVDYTYIWRLHSAPSEAEIEALFADEPTCVSREAYDEVFSWLVAPTFERGDRWGVMILQMQRAAAYAYIGLKDEARAILDDLLLKSEWMMYRSYLQAARKSPTYTPEGKIEL